MLKCILYVRRNKITFLCWLSLSFFGGGVPDEEEDRVVKGDDVIVELDASLEDLYMGGSLKVFHPTY